MSIFINKETRLLVQGITGRDGSFHAKQMLEYGTKVVAGVTPGKGGQKFEGKVPIFAWPGVMRPGQLGPMRRAPFSFTKG